jgi:dephospho-CoA kinase
VSGDAPSALRVALTGSIATGKSTCLAAFSALGVPTIDADVLSRDVVRAGTPGFARVVSHFGTALVGPDGQLDRAALAARVFDNPAERQALEAIVHPEVYDAIARWHDAQRALVTIADIPLLYETHHERDFALVIVAACPPDMQIARLKARNGLNDDNARARLQAQWPITLKVERADFVIDTGGSLEETHRQVIEIHERMLAIAKS